MKNIFCESNIYCVGGWVEDHFRRNGNNIDILLNKPFEFALKPQKLLFSNREYPDFFSVAVFAVRESIYVV